MKGGRWRTPFCPNLSCSQACCTSDGNPPPRILGVSELMTCAHTVRVCLWIDDYDSMELEGSESLNGIDVWKVKVVRGDSTSRFWIEEPLFRVHRKTIETPHMAITIESTYSPDDRQSPFPQQVVIKRTYNAQEMQKRNEHTVCTVKTFEAGIPISPDRFTLKAMDLPFNTPVVDYRISRNVGYWDGEGLSELPVYRGERPESPTAPSPPAAATAEKTDGSTGRMLLIAINAIVIAGLLLIIVWQRRRM